MPDRNEREAINTVLNDALEGSEAGTDASAQSGDERAHYHSGQSSGPKHNDAYVGTKQPDGSVKIEKIHSDDK
jgi:hypothetical protein